MSVALSDKARAMLGDMHPHMAESPTVQRIEDAVGRELQRVEDAAADIRDRVIPWMADDTYHTLTIWELILGLPVEPAGVSVGDRQDRVRLSIEKRRATSGADWTELVSQALGASVGTGPGDWYLLENGYQLIVLTPVSVFGQVVVIPRITPAHLELETGLTGVFLIGISDIGDDI